jgi:anti-anti-sigma regulatory factor
MSDALSSANLRDLQRRLALAQAEMDVVREFGLAIHAPRDLAPLYRLLYDLASRVMISDASFIALYETETRYLRNVFQIDKGVEYFYEEPWQPSDGGPTAWVVENGAPVRFSDFVPELRLRFPNNIDNWFGDEQESSRSWMTVPMLIDRELKGVINVQSYQAGVYGEREERLLITLGSMLAIALEHSQMVARLEAWRQALSAPLIPVSHDVLILPLIGRIDHERIAVAQRTLLVYVEKHRIRHVLIDLTGATDLSAEAGYRLEQLVRAVGLLGSQCALSGLRPELARDLTLRGIDLSYLTTVRDVEQGLISFNSAVVRGRAR